MGDSSKQNIFHMMQVSSYFATDIVRVFALPQQFPEAKTRLIPRVSVFRIELDDVYGSKPRLVTRQLQNGD